MIFSLSGSDHSDEELSQSVYVPMTDCQALSMESANTHVKVLASLTVVCGKLAVF